MKCPIDWIYIAGIAFLSAMGAHPFAHAQIVSRPPQYVLLAFDGSKSLSMWRETRDFSAHMRTAQRPLQFTYFISGVYFLTQKNKSLYQAPKHGKGASNIGFGGTDADLITRIQEVNQAYSEGHEIASHACGHFDGKTWSENDWLLEFAQFNHLIFGAFINNHLIPTPTQPQAWIFTEREVTGFRAPLLGKSDGLWQALKKNHYRYDTSRTSHSDYWPQKMKDGYWNFPLASLRIAGTGMRTLSMDYNFYYGQSGAKDDPRHSTLYGQQMLSSYLQYFNTNYNGNRAPLHIGHHFSLWNQGTYWNALKSFAEQVCGLPEVRCITYRELTEALDQLAPETLAAYQKGEFEHLPPQLIETPVSRPLDLRLRLGQSSSKSLEVELQGSDLLAAREQGAELKWSMDSQDMEDAHGGQLHFGNALKLSDEPHRVSVRLTSPESGDLARASHWIFPLKSGEGGFEMDPTDLEEAGLIGDLPEAHMNEPTW